MFDDDCGSGGGGGGMCHDLQAIQTLWLHEVALLELSAPPDHPFGQHFHTPECYIPSFLFFHIGGVTIEKKTKHNERKKKKTKST